MTHPLHPFGKKLLLVGWDSADWKIIRPLIEAGELPALAGLINRGASGNLATLEPVLSPMLWTSIATGKHALEHGVHGFTEVDPQSGKIVPISAATRQSRTLWEILADHDLRSNVVGWFATHGEQNPSVNLVSNLFPHAPRRQIDSPADWPAPPKGTYWPEDLAEHLNEQRLHPTELDGDLLRLFVPRAGEIDQTKDPRLFALAQQLAESISIQAATTWLMQHKPWDLTAVYFRAIDEISHHFMPFHPPQMDGVPSADFELYQDVVNSAYRFHDLMLARLIHLAGPDAAVVLVSDHGFHSDHLRPRYTPDVPAGIMVWHRPQGVMVAAGPGIAAEETIEAANLLDITPTILRWFGLPRGNDMAGRVLHDIFFGDPVENNIPTWEQDQASSDLTRPRLSDADNRMLLDQFIALGYIDELPADQSAAAATTQRENDWQLAQACLHAGRLESALPLLEEVFAAYPERGDYAQRLAHCQLRLGLLDEAEETVSVAVNSFKNPIKRLLLRANIAIQRGRHQEALKLLEQVQKYTPESLQLLEQISRAYLNLRRWDECEATCCKVLALDPDHALAWTGIARCQIHRGQSDLAIESAMESISLQPKNALAHLNLGLALSQLQRWEEAAQALRNTIALNPGLIPPYRLLARVLHQQGQTEAAEEIMERAKGARFVHDFQGEERRARIRTESRARATARTQARQRQRELEARRMAEAEASPALDLVIVSGLPRSGTSLMMQMLDAGGLKPLTDGKRIADESNPRGYFEWEQIKQLPDNPRLIEQAHGKVVKVVSPLLRYLPNRHRYKVIFMRRPIEQIVASQQRMIQSQGAAPQASVTELIRTQSEHLEQTLQLLQATPGIELLEIGFPDLVANPQDTATRLHAFLRESLSDNATPATLASVVVPQLHHHKSQPSA